MNKDLPKVYASPINHNLENVQNVYKSKDRSIQNKVAISDIDNILNSSRHIYRTKVKLDIDGKYENHTIISRKDNFLITIENKRIPIDKIRSIEVV